MKTTTIFNKKLEELYKLEVTFIIQRKNLYKNEETHIPFIQADLVKKEIEIKEKKAVIMKLIYLSGNSFYYLNKWNNYQNSIYYFFDWSL